MHQQRGYFIAPLPRQMPWKNVKKCMINLLRITKINYNSRNNKIQIILKELETKGDYAKQHDDTVSRWMILLGSLKSTRRFSCHGYNTVRTYRRVAYIPTWQAKNGNYFKNVLLGRGLNLIAKRRRTSPMLPSYALLRFSQSTSLSRQSIAVFAGFNLFRFR